MDRVPAGEIADRIVNLQALLARNGIDAAVIRQNADLFYFSGTVQDSHLVVPASGGPVLLVRRSVERATADSPIRPLIPMGSLSQLRDALFDACGSNTPAVVGFELDVLPANSFFLYDEKVFPKQRLVDVGALIREIRSVKSPWEIEMMRRAGEISTLVARSVPRFLKPGISEVELSAELECIAKKAGHTGVPRLRSFNFEMAFGHILAGPNGAVPAYGDTPTGGPGITPAFGQGAGNHQIAPSELVSVDIMISRDGYLNDQTRNFCIGAPPDKAARAYEFVKSVHERFRRIARPSAVPADLYETVLGWAEQEGWAPWFMGHAQPRVSFVGHGLGIEVDEIPFIARGYNVPLREGMVFAFEPKVILPREGAVGLENTYVVTPDGIESFNPATEELVMV